MCSSLPGDLGLPSGCHSLLGTTWLRICVCRLPRPVVSGHLGGLSKATIERSALVLRL